MIFLFWSYFRALFISAIEISSRFMFIPSPIFGVRNLGPPMTLSMLRVSLKYSVHLSICYLSVVSFSPVFDFIGLS